MAEYYIHGSLREGPYDLPALLAKARIGKLLPNTLISDEKGTQRPAQEWPRLCMLLEKGVYSPQAYTVSEAFRFFKQALHKGWRTTAANPHLCVWAGLGVMVSFGLGALAADYMGWHIGALIGLMLITFFQQWLMAAMLPATIGRRIRMRQVAPLTLAAGISALCIGSGLVLALVPGVVALSVLSFSSIIIVDHDLPPVRAIGRSYVLAMYDNEIFGALFGLSALYSLGLATVIFLPVLLPVITAAFIDVYEKELIF